MMTPALTPKQLAAAAEHLTPEQLAEAAERVVERMVLLTAAQVAAILGVSERYVWRLGREGELRRTVIGKHVAFHPADVDAFIAERREGPRRRRAHVEQPDREERRPTPPRSRSSRGVSEGIRRL